jgi:thioredoxin-dependent peroxiredoxin
MSKTALKGNPVAVSGNLPKTGNNAPDFKLVKADLSETLLKDFKGKRIVVNIFPSIDTPVCATSVRTFNKQAGELKNTVVLCVSRDLPFAQGRFCGAEGLENVVTLSDFRTGKFGRDYGVEIVDGPLAGLLARAVLVVDEEGKIIYTELVPEITQEPDYKSALYILK